MNIAHKIINLDGRDYHMHTSTFSDGLNTIDEIVQFAWKIWLSEIAITDHSQICLDWFIKRGSFYRWWARRSIKHRHNVHNDVQVIFGVEWDILNKDWDVCLHIQNMQPDFCILSAHSDVYCWSPESVTDATIKAIERYHDQIKFLAHPCNNWDFWVYIDIQKIVDVANHYKVPLELNWKNLLAWKTNIEKLHVLLQKADQIYLNSDAHTLYQLRDSRKFSIEWLKENEYLG